MVQIAWFRAWDLEKGHAQITEMTKEIIIWTYWGPRESPTQGEGLLHMPRPWQPFIVIVVTNRLS